MQKDNPEFHLDLLGNQIREGDKVIYLSTGKSAGISKANFVVNRILAKTFEGRRAGSSYRGRICYPHNTISLTAIERMAIGKVGGPNEAKFYRTI